MRQKNQVELNSDTGAKGEAQSVAIRETEASAATASLERPAVAGPSMEAILERENLKKALAQVKRNKGAPGIDGMTVEDLGPYLKEHWLTIRAQLLEGTYRPQPVRRVEIPKASGGLRLLGIPSVLDRLIQQAVMQVLQADWDGTFSEASFGFRPGRSAHQAVERAQAYIASGHAIVVDLDLEKFFDRVNHDILMGLVAKRVADKRLLKLIRAFLNAGVMDGGLVSPTEEGVPQGGPLSPLLSNLMLDVLDKELEKRGHRFVRYADDCNIYVRSQRAGERVMAGIERFLEKRLKLKVNKAKSAVAKPSARKLLGFSFTGGKEPRRRIAPQAIARFKAKVRELTRRTGGNGLSGRQGTVHLPCRLAWLFWLLPNPVGAAQT
jgi:RNA-directed DNA polymerase